MALDPEYQRTLRSEQLELLKKELRNAKSGVDRAVELLSDHTRLGYKTEPPVNELHDRLAYFIDVVGRLRDLRDGFQTMPRLPVSTPDRPREHDVGLQALVDQPVERTAWRRSQAVALRGRPGDDR